MENIFVLLVLCVSMSAATLVEYKYCDPYTPWFGPEQNTMLVSVNGTQIIPCENPMKCDLIIGDTHTVKFDFVPQRDVSSLSVQIYGRPPLPLSAWFPFKFFPDDGCENHGLTCVNGGLKANTKQVFEKSLEIPKYLPMDPVDVRITLEDENKQNLVCIEMTTALKNRM